jgi:hypothetical protein
MSIAFDTLDFFKELESAGLTRKQAEVQAHAFARALDESVAFDALAYERELNAAGYTRRQAEVLARTLARVVEENRTTRRVAKNLRMGFDS